jgi:dienelactone hydrolase
MKNFIPCIFLLLCLFAVQGVAQSPIADDSRILIISGGWQLAGDLLIPPADQPLPAVLLLNQAAGDRSVYEDIARDLAERGIASLRLDLRGHGESTNLGRFVPGDEESMAFPWDSEIDVSAAHEFLKSHPAIDGRRIGMVGASYSGEEMAQAGRNTGPCQAYVALSPGSFSEESIGAIDSSEIPWLIVIAKDDEFLQSHIVALQEMSHKVELVIIPGSEHATNILDARPDIAERVVIWFAYQLRAGAVPH